MWWREQMGDTVQVMGRQGQLAAGRSREQTLPRAWRKEPALLTPSFLTSGPQNERERHTIALFSHLVVVTCYSSPR